MAPLSGRVTIAAAQFVDPFNCCRRFEVADFVDFEGDLEEVLSERISKDSNSRCELFQVDGEPLKIAGRLKSVASRLRVGCESSVSRLRVDF